MRSFPISANSTKLRETDTGTHQPSSDRWRPKEAAPLTSEATGSGPGSARHISISHPLWRRDQKTYVNFCQKPSFHSRSTHFQKQDPLHCLRKPGPKMNAAPRKSFQSTVISLQTPVKSFHRAVKTCQKPRSTNPSSSYSRSNSQVFVAFLPFVLPPTTQTGGTLADVRPCPGAKGAG